MARVAIGWRGRRPRRRSHPAPALEHKRKRRERQHELPSWTTTSTPALPSADDDPVETETEKGHAKEPDEPRPDRLVVEPAAEAVGVVQPPMGGSEEAGDRSRPPDE